MMLDLGVVYVMSIGNFIKIGMTKSPKLRFTTLNKLLEKDKKIKMFIPSVSHVNYRQNEKILHKRFSRYRVGYTEFFDITADKVIRVFSSLTFKRNNRPEVPKKIISKKCEIIPSKNILLTPGEIQEKLRDRNLNYSEIARETGLAYRTVLRLRDKGSCNDVTRKLLSDYLEKNKGAIYE